MAYLNRNTAAQAHGDAEEALTVKARQTARVRGGTSWMWAPDLEHWSVDAKCRHDPDVTTDWFFPERGHPDGRGAAIAAYCAGCPVQAQCLEDNLDEREGWYGGMSPAQRWRHPRRKQVAAERQRFVAETASERWAKMRAAGMTLAAIAEATGSTTNTVHRHLRSLGVEKGPKIPPAETDLWEAMSAEGISIRDIAALRGYERTKVHRHLQTRTGDTR